jgi:formiminoglutamate deiminase
VAALWFEEALLAGGWAERVRITIAGTRIASLATGVAPGPDDHRHTVALPGLANLHSHAFQRAMAGLTEVRGPAGDSFWTWREIMYRFLAALTPADVEAIAALAYAEMLEAGFTRVGEFHYLHNDPSGAAYANPAEMAERHAAAAAETGIALTLLPSFYAHGGCGGAPPLPGQRRFVTSLDGFARLHEGCRRAAGGLADSRVGVAPHSLRAVTPDEIEALAALAGDGVIHIHASEQVREVEDCIAWSGRRPVEWLLERALIDRRWCLIHATHMVEAETRALARSGAVAGLCPLTEASLGDGTFDGSRFLAAGGRLGVGSDSNVLIDAAGELRQLETTQRLRDRARNVLAEREGASSGRTLFGAALAGGAQALAAEPQGLAEGLRADIVTLDGAHPSLAGRRRDRLLDAWIFACPRGAIDTVWSAGRLVVAGGRHVAHQAIAQRYAGVLRRILAD